VVSSFNFATSEGPLCGEPMRGLRVNLTDVVLHSDSVHRGEGQIIHPVQRLVHACLLSSSPRLVEPIYLVEIVAPFTESNAVYGVITRGRGEVISIEPRLNTPLCTFKAYLPVLSSFGLSTRLLEATHGKAIANHTLSHWQIIQDDPLEEGSFSNNLVKEMRERKKMRPHIQTVDELVDRL